jgi:formate dehydrogenase iron-sulfur subunit
VNEFRISIYRVVRPREAPRDGAEADSRKVRFDEHKIDGKVQWLFSPDQCRHCQDPSCKGAADSFLEGAIVVDEATGAVIHTDATKKLTKEQFEDIRTSCPYNIPRRDEKTGLLAKYDMRIDRLKANMVPA